MRQCTIAASTNAAAPGRSCTLHHESSFATVRHRTERTKGCLTRDGTLAMIYKLAACAPSAAGDDSAVEWLAKIVDGVTFHDGVEVQNVVRCH